MIVLGLLSALFLLLFLLHTYDVSGLTGNQFSFLLYSSVFAFLIIVCLSSMLFPEEGQTALTLLSDEKLLPILFYILWLYSSMVTGNKLTGHSGDWRGFQSGQGAWVSRPDE